MACPYVGVSRAAGTTFASEDGCNTCICRPDGQVACTAKACASNGDGSSGGTGGADGTGGTSGTGGTDGTGAAGGAPGGITACGHGAPTDATSGWIVFDSDRANFNRDIYTIRPDGSQLTRLTDEPGIDKEPASSPDGRWLVFTSDRSSSMQIHLMDRQQGSVAQLTHLADGADQATFSHDGNLIAFRSGHSIYTIHSDGSGQTLVTFRPNDPSLYGSPRFAVGDQELVVDRLNEIDAAHLDSTGFRMIVQNWTTTIQAPSISPAGNEVAYYVFCGTPNVAERGTSIWTTPFSTTTNPCAGRRVTPPNEPNSENPSWGPGDTFAYERIDSTSNVAAIALISRAPGSQPCILTSDLADSRHPSWSP